MIVYVCFAWIQLRCISSCLDMIDCKPWTETLLQSDPSPPLLRHLSYVFYLPLMFLGPFVLYRDFEHSVSVLLDKLLRKCLISMNCVHCKRSSFAVFC